MIKGNLNHQNHRNFIACIWDFDKTLIKGYMQEPIFEEYGIDSKRFWSEVNSLPKIYKEKGYRVAEETSYLNHLLSYIQDGHIPNLTNKKLKELGKKLVFYDGLPEFFKTLKQTPERYETDTLSIQLEHYIISTGLAEMIRGSQINQTYEMADLIDGIFACELIPRPTTSRKKSKQKDAFNEHDINLGEGLDQIGMIVDNTIKTRFIFEINKGSNKNRAIDVNSKIEPKDRRVPFENMIYIADGPSDVPVFSLLGEKGGYTYAVYERNNAKERKQNKSLQDQRRVNDYGHANYTKHSETYDKLIGQVEEICERICNDYKESLKKKVGQQPRHIN